MQPNNNSATLPLKFVKHRSNRPSFVVTLGWAQYPKREHLKMNGAGFYRSDALFVAQSMHWRKLSTGGNRKNCKFILSWYIYWVLKEGMPHLHDGSLMPTHQYSKWEFFSITWCSTLYFHYMIKKAKIAHTQLPSVGFRSWSRFLAVSRRWRES